MATLSFSNKWHRFRKCFFLSNSQEPACFGYSDGTIRQNDNLKKKMKILIVFHHLINDFQSNRPDAIETAKADGMFILNLKIQNLPKTYSALPRKVLVKILNLKLSQY